MNTSQEKAYFAGGCFWGVQHYLGNLDGVTSTSVGYIGGTKENPSYEEVCSKKTGHAEAVEVIFDNTKINFEKIAKLFFEIHDPEQINKQGPDIGSQYRSAIFYTNESQKNTSQKLIDTLVSKGYEVQTELKKADTYWKAEEYHQKYYEKNGNEPYCHSRKIKF